MKRVFPFLMLFVAAVFTACSSDDDNTFKVSFESNNYTLTKGNLAINITASNAPETVTEIPVVFGGTAKMDEDYTVSAQKYVVGGSAPVMSIVVTAKNNFTESKTITMGLSGVEGGANPTTTINLGVQDKRLYSFVQKAYVMGNEVEVELSLLNIKDGSTYTAENDIEVSVAADAASTAVEGTNYEFVNKTATILKGSSKCAFKLRAVTLDTEKNVIVLAPQVTEAEGFVKGAFPTVTVTMIGSYASDLLGTWVMNELITTKDGESVSMWNASEKDLEGWPTFNADDTFTFSGDGSAEGYKLTTSLKSELKNYFRETSDFAIDKEITLRFDMSGKKTFQLLKLENVNRYFSATEVSTDKVAYIGVKNVTDSESGETLLDVYIIDYNSKSFMPVFETDGYYNAEKPTATMGGMQVNFTLKKKK